MATYFTATGGDPAKNLTVGARPTLLLVTGADRERTLRDTIEALPRSYSVIVIDPAQANPDITRAQRMRAALRQDPDVIAVDLVDGPDDAALLVTGAFSGHWMIAGISAADAASALTRLRQWCEPGVRETFSALVIDSASGATASLTREADPPSPPLSLEDLYTVGDRGEPPSRTTPLLETLRDALEPFRRTAWRPLRSDPEGASSKMGGRPWLAKDEAHPAGRGGGPLVLALQLDLATLPLDARAVLGGEGFLQFFRDDRNDDEKANVARLLASSPTNVLSDSPPVARPKWTARAITGWEAFDDFPHNEDWGDLGIALSDDDRDGIDIVNRIRDEHVDAFVRQDDTGRKIASLFASELAHYGIAPANLLALRRYRRPAFGDKLLGWPNWEQGPGWPDDSAGVRMRYLFQIEFDDEFDCALPALISTDGRGHLFRSERDPLKFAFPWACG